MYKLIQQLIMAMRTVTTGQNEAQWNLFTLFFPLLLKTFFLSRKLKWMFLFPKSSLQSAIRILYLHLCPEHAQYYWGRASVVLVPVSPSSHSCPATSVRWFCLGLGHGHLFACFPPKPYLWRQSSRHLVCCRENCCRESYIFLYWW